MRIRFKFRKGSTVYVSVFAGLAFVAMAVVRFDLSVAKVLEFLAILLGMLLVLILLAAPFGLAIRWWMNRKD